MRKLSHRDEKTDSFEHSFIQSKEIITARDNSRDRGMLFENETPNAYLLAQQIGVLPLLYFYRTAIKKINT